MEPVNGTPSRYDSKGDDIKLRTELNAILEKELEKPPDEMDTKKMDSVIELLSNLEENKSVRTDMSKKQFAEKYLRGVLRKRKKAGVYVRAAMFFLGVIVCISICNIISVRVARTF